MGWKIRRTKLSSHPIFMLLSQHTKDSIEAGTDEVGRGCLAGEVVAAAVILPKNYQNENLKDSKKLTARQRQKLEAELKKEALAWAIGIASPQEIDEINILNASILAMHRALDQLSLVPELILVDGKFFKSYQQIPNLNIIKGDNKYLSIAAASIIAKNHRDQLMQNYAQKYTGYGWETNVGYPTKKHYEGIQNQGITPLHRQSFKLFK